MKKLINAFAVIAIVGALQATNLNAQGHGYGYSSPCSERGGCHYGDNDSIELIPYGNANYRQNRMPFDAGLRHGSAYADSEFSNGYPVCGYGGTYGRDSNRTQQYSTYSKETGTCRGIRCPFEQGGRYQERDLGSEYANHQSTLRDQRPQSNFGPSRNEYYQAPRSGIPTREDLAPAATRPRLNAPSYSPGSNLGGSRFESNELQGVPPTSTKITPPPVLPRQPLSRDQQNRDPRIDSGASINRLPQLLPPTNPSQKSGSGTDSCGCGHDH